LQVVPSHDGRGLVNVIAELEARLAGNAPSPRLAHDLASAIPDSSSYILVMFDGLGDAQLAHPAAAALAASRAGVIDAPFPTTTVVSLATIATGLSPSRHGAIAHLLWLPELQMVVNTLKWVTKTGDLVGYPTIDWLPRPNLWERLAAAGVATATVQPGDFANTPLTGALYRGTEFVPFDSPEEAVAVTIEAALRPGLVFLCLPDIDYAAHVFGQESEEYGDTLLAASRLWTDLGSGLPEGATVVGMADHGILDVGEGDKLIVRDPDYDMLDLYGDPRGVMGRGSKRLLGRLAERTGARLVEPHELRRWFGPGPALAELDGRLPDALLLAPEGKVILPRGFDKRLRGYHGGLDEREVRVPLLVVSKSHGLEASTRRPVGVSSRETLRP
jgi:hypothetical protein